MSEKTKLKIGEFSKLMQVTVKTLRHYEQLELLKPADVDQWTGYRYYSIEQMQRLSSIRELKNLGFSLEEIRLLYDEEYHEPSLSQLKTKIADCNIQIRNLLKRRQQLIDMANSKRTSRQWKSFQFNHYPQLSWLHIAELLNNTAIWANSV